MEISAIRVKKIKPDAVLPTYGSEFSAGADLYACIEKKDILIAPGETVFIPTGLYNGNSCRVCGPHLCPQRTRFKKRARAGEQSGRH